MGREDLRWFELFNRRATRRELLHAGAAAAALVAFGGTFPARREDARPRFRREPFDLGVASGDPLPDSVVLWTRLNHEAENGETQRMAQRARLLGVTVELRGHGVVLINSK